MLAVVFSKGFGWIDDQFLVIEIAQSWVDGTDFYNWLPWTEGNTGPKGFSFFYPGLHYLLFRFLEAIGMTAPQSKMYVVRFLHAAWSMLTIYYGYRITLLYDNEKTARRAGWLLAVFWIFPFLSVRNLVEYVSIPLLMAGIYFTLRSLQQKKTMIWLWIGVLFGMAVNIRYQTVLIAGGVGLAILFRNKWKETLLMAAGVLLSVGIIQGGIDYYIWGKPFVQMISYITYNVSSAGQYTVGPWYHYLLFLLGILIPPVSVYLLLGFIRSYKRMSVIFIPVLIFIIFHSWYPNKQERFITTIVPLLMVSGLVGWGMIKDGILNPTFVRKWIRWSWVFFWVVNFLALIPVSVMYSKKARVESMSYLSKYDNINYFVIEDENKDVLRFPPEFYLGQWVPYDTFQKKDDFEEFRKEYLKKKKKDQPAFVLFFQPNNIERRVNRMKTVFPELEFETMVEPGMMDNVLHWLNPINDNQNIYIYRNKNVVPEKVDR